MLVWRFLISIANLSLIRGLNFSQSWILRNQIWLLALNPGSTQITWTVKSFSLTGIHFLSAWSSQWHQGGGGGGIHPSQGHPLLVASRQKTLETDCEVIWVKTEAAQSKLVYLAAYYRPHENDFHSFEEFCKSVDMVSKKNGHIWILGDLNYPKFHWNDNHVPQVKKGCSFPQQYDDFTNLLDDNNLIKMVSEPTRQDNTLDLFLTNNDSLVSKVTILPGISDHDIVSCMVRFKPIILKQVPRVIPLYRKADWTAFKAFAKDKCEELLKDHPSKSVEDLWSSFKSVIHNGIAKFVPSKILGTKKTLPWITQPIKRLIRKRNKIFHKQKSLKSPTDRHHFLRVKQHIKMKIRQSYDLYIEDIIGLNSNSDRKDQNTVIELTDSKKGQSQFSIKKLFSLIKNSRQDSEGIAPLQMPNSENWATQNKDKADIANQQFQKAFSKKAPLSLNQLATQVLQNGMDNDKIGSHSVPPSLHSKYQPMPEITISVPGIIKLLCNLNPSKASGPDSIKPIVLKNLSNEIALFLSVLFQKSLDSGQVPHDWTKACFTPIFKKGG